MSKADVTLTTDMNVEPALKQARRLRKGIGDELENMKVPDKVSPTLQHSIDNVIKKLDEARNISQQIRKLQENPIKSRYSVETEEYKKHKEEVAQQTAEVARFQKQLDKAKESWEKFQIGKRITTDDIQNALRKYEPGSKEKITAKDYTIFTKLNEIAEAKAGLQAAKDELDSMKFSGEQFREVIVTTEEDIQKLKPALEKSHNELSQMYSKLIRSKEWKEEVLPYQTSATQTDETIKEEGESAKTTTQSLASLDGQKQKTKASNAELGDEAERTKNKLFGESTVSRELTSTLKTLGNALKKAWSGMKSLAKHAKDLVNRMRGIKVNTDGATNSIKGLLKFAMKYVLGLRTLFILYKRLRSAGVEAYKGLASQFPELQAELDQLKISFFQLKNSIATMAQPILSYLVPAIKTLMGWLVAAMNALANFFAILTGAKYIYKATKTNNALAKSIKGSGKAAKEANKDIAEYDNLILIQQNNDNGGGGGAGDLDQYAGAFEKVAAESDFAQKLKDAINKGDWEGVGSLFAKKVNGLVSKYDNWINNVLRPKGVMWSERIARILNGFVDNFKGTEFGEAIADSLNTVADIINTFFTKFDFRKLGVRVGNIINGLSKRLDPKLIGKTIANRFNAAIHFASGLLKTTDFGAIGEFLGTTLRELIETVDFAELGEDFSLLANGVLESVNAFFEFSNAGVTIGNAINRLLSKIDFAKLAKNLSEFAINLLNAIADAIETVDWVQVGQAIVDFLTNIDWTRFLSALVKVAWALIKGLGTALLQIATDPEALMSIATPLLVIFGAKFIWNRITGLFKSGLTNAISGGLSGISLAKIAAGIGAYELGGRIGSAIMTNLGEALDWDKDLVNEYKKFGDAPILYTLNTVKEAVEAASEYSQTTGKTTLGNAWHDMWAGITGDKTTSEMAVEQAEEAAKAASDKLERFQFERKLGRAVTDAEWFAQKYGTIVDGMTKVSDDALLGMGELINAVVDGAKMQVEIGRSTLTELETDSNHYAEIAKTNAGVAEQAKNEMIESSNHYIAIAKENAGVYDRIQKEQEESSNHYVAIAKANAGIIETDTDNMVNHIKEAVSPIPDEYSQVFDSAKNNVESAFGGVSSFFDKVAQGIKTPFGTMSEFFKDTFSTSWNNVVSVFKTNTPEFQSIQDSISGSFKTMINGMISGVNNSITSPFSTLKNLINQMRGFDVGGSKIFQGLPSITIPKIPQLAQGAVLPPNNPFVAVVGDQKRGTNVEAPLDVIAEALRQVLSENNSSNNQPIVLQLNGNQIAQAVWDEENKRYKQTGSRFRFS